MRLLLRGRNQVAYSFIGNLTGSGLEASRLVLGGHGDVAVTLPGVSRRVELRREFSDSENHQRKLGRACYADAA